MPTRTVHSDGSFDLATFQTNVQQQEEIFGPLLAMSTTGQDNELVLEIASAPSNRAVLEKIDSDAAPEKPGHRVICTGNVFVNRSKQSLAAYRKLG